MRMPKRGEKGFTLIELLIVVAILGVLAAIVIPNVGRFIGAGQEEAKETELSTVQAAVSSMMVDNKLVKLPSPIIDADAAAGTQGTNDMNAFPDDSSGAAKGVDDNGQTFDALDGVGWVLWQCDRIAADSSATTNLTNYVVTRYTTYWYIVDDFGTVEQSETVDFPP